MFVCFICAWLGFNANKFLTKSEKNFNIYLLPHPVHHGGSSKSDIFWLNNVPYTLSHNSWTKVIEINRLVAL